MRWLLALVIVCGCDSGAPAPTKAPSPPPPPTARECELLLGHLVDLEFAEHPESATKDVAEAKATVVQAKRDEFVASCRSMTRERVTCAMAATTVAAIAACDR